MADTPTPAELAAMKAQKAESDNLNKSKEAYDKASPMGKSIPPLNKKASGGSIRGGGIESRGKTKGRMV